MEKMFSHIMKTGGDKIHSSKLQHYLEESTKQTPDIFSFKKTTNASKKVFHYTIKNTSQSQCYNPHTLDLSQDKCVNGQPGLRGMRMLI